MYRAFRYRLYPTANQAAMLRQTISAARFVYNLALEQRRDWWRPGRRFSFPQQSRELTLLRAQVDWLRACVRVPQEQALRDLDNAFVNFFSGRAAYPRWRKAGVNEAARFKFADMAVESESGRFSHVRIPGIGQVSYRDTRAIKGRCLSATVSLCAGRWFISFACEMECAASPPLPASVGIDRGIANAVALSTGDLLQIPARLADIDKRHRRAQRTAARRRIGSKRRARALRRATALSARSSRIRIDFNHRASTSIARRFGHVAIEDLRVVNMSKSAAGTVDAPGKGVAQKRGLNRSIRNQGWGQFARLLEYKMKERGGQLTKVPAQFTSQTCSACGVVDAQSRESQATFACVHCGHREHADTNAAKEILRRSASGLDVEASRWRADEASTRTASAA